jgi:hypothetical protein
MPTLNRFPLLGLWAEEAARRLGYTGAEAEALGHAYAVLYAIRARGKPKQPAEEKPAARKPAKRAKTETLRFCGDDLPVTRDADGHVRGLVGHEKPQTAASYRAAVAGKFPEGYHDRLRACFRRLFKQYPPRRLDGRLVYDLYDEWKKSCGVGRLVDLDKLLDWCEAHARPDE